MQEDLGKNGLEKLKRRLYQKGEKFEEERKRISGERIVSPPPYWQSPQEKKFFNPPPKKRSKTLLIIIIALVLILSGLAVYFILSGTNVVSSKNIGIEIKGPTYGEAGKIMGFNVFLENKNKVALESADLIIDFPESSFSLEGVPLTRLRFPLGQVNAGAVINKAIEVVFLGLEDEGKKLNITLEYRLADSNAIFAKSQDYDFKVISPALGLSIALPKEVNSKQEMNLGVEIVSNAESITKNLGLEMSYPSGFRFLSAEPRPSRGNNFWSLGDLAPLQKKEIVIRGFVEGQDLEKKSFNATVGILDDRGAIKSYGFFSQSVVIKRSPLSLSIFINDRDLEKNIARPGESMRGELEWVNNLPTEVREARLELAFLGKILDEEDVSASGGFYQSIDKKIIWNSTTLPSLALVSPGQTGQAQFSFSTKEVLPINSAIDKNFSLVLEAKISGVSTSAEVGSLEVVTEVKKEIKIASPLVLTPTALYYSGPFENSGPMPPKVNQETIYTILWSLGGNSNDFSKLKARASLPPYVRWLNVLSPSDAKLKFNQAENALVWEVGDLKAGTGIISLAKEVAFQVALLPSLSQVGESPSLISGVSIEGYDNFTSGPFNAQTSSLNTILNYDEKFKSGEGKIVP